MKGNTNTLKQKREYKPHVTWPAESPGSWLQNRKRERRMKILLNPLLISGPVALQMMKTHLRMLRVQQNTTGDKTTHTWDKIFPMFPGIGLLLAQATPTNATRGLKDRV